VSARLPRRPINRRASGIRTWSGRYRPGTTGRLFVAALAAVAYIPLLLTHRGMVSADINSALYLDPSRLLGRATSMWNPSAGMGTVSRDNIGYLWPIGPWYRVLAAAGVPAWVAQRLWIATLLLVAGLGVRWLVRTLAWSGPGLAVATVAYMLSPYVLQYEGRMSPVLLGFSALPWMLALTIRAVRTRSWRYPALFALVAATAGALNATGMIYAALAAVLWLPFAVWGLGETTWQMALATLAKMLGLSVLAALWWLAAVAIQGG
jgi:arabinofuranan 3-O-arabinosyltransferase